MARFSHTFIEAVAARTDIVEIIARHVELKKSGSNMMGLCPFHHEKTPSFSVSVDKQFFHCFGCGKGGDVFRFLMEHDGYSFPEAVEYLAEKAGMAIPQDDVRQPADYARQKQALDLLQRASEAMYRALQSEQGAAARAYLERRQLPAEIVRDYRLGYAPDGYGFMNRTFGHADRTNAMLEAVGLLFKGERGYGDRFRDRLMFTIRNRRGQVVGFGGRVLGDGNPKYLNSPETDWFHKSELLYGYAEHRDEIRKMKRLVVVEGYMDVLALAAHGLKCGLAPLGTAIGEGQIREIFRLCDAPIFSFDGDRAGRQAAWRALERMMPLLKSELSPKFLYLPEGEDPDSLLQREGHEAFVARLEQASKPVLETWLMGLKLLAGQGAEGRARMAKKADAMLATMSDHYLRTVWRQEVERATGVALQSQGRVARREHRFAAEDAVDAVDRAPEVPLNRLQERFLAGLMQQSGRFAQLPAEAKGFFVDLAPIHELYSRAFSITADAEDNKTDIARQLAQEFPDCQALIARWVNQASVTDIEFKSLLLDMEASAIRLRLHQKPGLDESIRLNNRLRMLQQQQQELTEQLSEELQE